mmetsp:Transcript_677/g.872  ORF Transcript_677/g.872 Transcript_677/m.872 type:complete len:95 (-) Transcript_677:328-612(-)
MRVLFTQFKLKVASFIAIVWCPSVEGNRFDVEKRTLMEFCTINLPTKLLHMMFIIIDIYGINGMIMWEQPFYTEAISVLIFIGLLLKSQVFTYW